MKRGNPQHRRTQQCVYLSVDLLNLIHWDIRSKLILYSTYGILIIFEDFAVSPYIVHFASF